MYQRAHGCDVDDFEVIHVDGSVHVDVLSDFSKHGHQSHVGLASTLCLQRRMLLTDDTDCQAVLAGSGGFPHRRGANQQVLVRLHGRLEQLALDAVQGFKALEAGLRVLGQLVDGHENLVAGRES